MILEIIPIPIQVRTNKHIEMSTPLFLRNPLLRDSESLWSTSRDLLNQNQLHRYKIIEISNDAILEHIVVSFDELDPISLGLVEDHTVSVDLYPISTKIVRHNDRPSSAYRHRKGIEAVISKLIGCEKESLDSVHKMFIDMVGHGMWQYKLLNMARHYDAFKKSMKPRIDSLITHDESACDLLLNKMGDMTEILQINQRIADDPAFLFDIVENLSSVPQLSADDRLSKRCFNKSSIQSLELKPIVNNYPYKRTLAHLVASHDIFPIDEDVEYSLPIPLRAYLLPLIDQMGILPYTDLSITIAPNDLHVNYAVSIVDCKHKLETIPENYGSGRSYSGLAANQYMFKAPTYVEQLARVLGKMAIMIGLDARTVKCNLVKTFREDVYIEFYEDDNPRFDDYVNSNRLPTKFYFDLTMCALGTRAIVSKDMVDAITPDHY